MDASRSALARELVPPAEAPVDQPTAQATLAAYHKDARLLVHTAELVNIETPPRLLDSMLTPLERFFVRNNRPSPCVAPENWQLTIDGLVRRPLTIDYAELREMPISSYHAVLECSGNSRARFAAAGTPAEGVAWGDGAVGHAEWIGVAVSLLFEQAGLKRGALQAECISYGDDPLVRGVEIDKLIEDGMLAFAMNGQPLSAEHGGPVRLVVPGWGGINWVKWIAQMTVISHESAGEFNQDRYVLYDGEGLAQGKVRELGVKSLITTLADGACLPSGPQIIGGFAWSAARGVARVEVSVDGGASWAEASLGADLGPRAWRAFSYAWHAGEGQHTLAVRATDLEGNSQPLSVPFNRRGYLMNAVQRISVRVS
jgi:sulfite oxidase